MTPQVSAIIVNFNSGDYLPRVLSSVVAQTIYPDIEIIVVDNASSDHSMGYLQDFPQVRAVSSPVNTGFAGGQNTGLRMARGRYLMPLNFDIELEADFVERMVSALEREPAAGSVCGKLMQMTPAGQRSDRFYSTGHLLPHDRFPLHRGAGEADRGQYDRAVRVFGAPGAAPLYRREMIDDIAYEDQYYDETFFTWYEDVDLDWRAGWRGWYCLFAPDAVAHHVGGVSANIGSEFYVTTTIRNRWMMIAADECPHCLRQNRRALLAYELGLLGYVTRIGRLAAYGRALSQYRARLPYIKRKRDAIRARAVVACPLSL